MSIIPLNEHLLWYREIDKRIQKEFEPILEKLKNDIKKYILEDSFEFVLNRAFHITVVSEVYMYLLEYLYSCCEEYSSCDDNEFVQAVKDVYNSYPKETNVVEEIINTWYNSSNLTFEDGEFINILKRLTRGKDV